MAFLCCNHHLLSASSSLNTAATTCSGAHLCTGPLVKKLFPERRKRWKAYCPSTVCSLKNPVLDEPAFMELPCLPFNPAEVFIPTAMKTLHLYEARFLALLEEVRRMEVGALVTIRGVGRVNLAKLTQLKPFLKGSLVPVLDVAASEMKDLDAAVEGLKLVLADVQRLQIKLRTSKDELLQTPLENALQWAEKGMVQEVARNFVPSKAESLSFAALQPVTSASATELHALLQARINAMEVTNTLQRLHTVTKHAEQNRSSLAAKVALQSLQF